MSYLSVEYEYLSPSKTLNFNMLKFFRKIRKSLLWEDKVGRYFKYAIGEIVLVVIGILIALSINNWNENRKDNLKEAILIKNIIEDLNSDAEVMDKAYKELSEQLEVLDQLISKAMDESYDLNHEQTGLVRYSSDFRPIAQRNHSEAVSYLDDEIKRELIQDYFLSEDQVRDIFLEYEKVIHNEVRPYLREHGAHNLESLYTRKGSLKIKNLLDPGILEVQLGVQKFQQVLFERRLKTDTFRRFISDLKSKNAQLIEILKGL